MSLSNVMPISVSILDRQESTESLVSEGGLLSPRFDTSTIAHAMAANVSENRFSVFENFEDDSSDIENSEDDSSALENSEADSSALENSEADSSALESDSSVAMVLASAEPEAVSDNSVSAVVASAEPAAPSSLVSGVSAMAQPASALITPNQSIYGEWEDNDSGTIIDIEGVTSDGKIKGKVSPTSDSPAGFPQQSGEFTLEGVQDLTSNNPSFSFYVDWENGAFSSFTGYLTGVSTIIVRGITVTGSTTSQKVYTEIEEMILS